MVDMYETLDNDRVPPPPHQAWMTSVRPAEKTAHLADQIIL